MARLNQIIAIEKGIKSKSVQELTGIQQTLQKPALFSGIARTYRPKDQEGEQLPPESNRVQVKAEEVLRQTVEVLVLAPVRSRAKLSVLGTVSNSDYYSKLSIHRWMPKQMPKDLLSSDAGSYPAWSARLAPVV